MLKDTYEEAFNLELTVLESESLWPSRWGAWQQADVSLGSRWALMSLSAGRRQTEMTGNG